MRQANDHGPEVLQRIRDGQTPWQDPEEVKKMLERHELHGYRDGADWKFKVEDIDRLVAQRPRSPPRKAAATCC